MADLQHGGQHAAMRVVYQRGAADLVNQHPKSGGVARHASVPAGRGRSGRARNRGFPVSLRHHQLPVTGAHSMGVRPFTGTNATVSNISHMGALAITPTGPATTNEPVNTANAVAVAASRGLLSPYRNPRVERRAKRTGGGPVAVLTSALTARPSQPAREAKNATKLDDPATTMVPAATASA